MIVLEYLMETVLQILITRGELLYINTSNSSSTLELAIQVKLFLSGTETPHMENDPILIIPSPNWLSNKIFGGLFSQLSKKFKPQGLTAGNTRGEKFVKSSIRDSFSFFDLKI